MSERLPLQLETLKAAYAEGTSPITIIAQCYERIEQAQDPALFLCLREIDEVIAEAESLPDDPTSLPLWGIPFVIKDNIDAEGLPTTAACPAYRYIAERDAFAVARLKEAGAILIGKTNLDQFATGLVGVRSPFGIPRNAVDPELVPGGSSSGSAVAVARGIACFSFGTDTAGSGRVPAAMNDIVGLKPTLGMISATGVIPACRTLDTISIFANSVQDAHAVLSICGTFDPSDAYARAFPLPPIASPNGPLHIGIPSKATIEFFGDTVQASMLDDAIAVMKAQGAAIEELDFTPFYDVADMLYEGAWVAERYTVIETLLKQQPDAVHPTTRQIINAGSTLSAADTFRGIYRLQELRRVAEKLMEGIDLLCVPTIPTFYTLKDLEADPIQPNSNLGTYTNFVNLMDMCGIAVPVAKRSDGKPGSITFLGSAGSDAFCASAALKLTGQPLPPASTPHEGKVELAVCGAHMSGLPLNHQLTSRGGTLVKSTKTAPLYKLFALPGGPPFRPGMLKCDEGAAIDLEVWSLPLSELGSFMTGIPSPLGIGRVQLDDDSECLGFLVEAAGTQGAKDITHLKSWRNFIAQTMEDA